MVYKNGSVDHEILLGSTVDSTGIRVANRGERMRHRWKKTQRRGFLKIHVTADIRTKRILSIGATDERSHDAQHLPSLIEHAEKRGNKITKVLAGGAYDSKDNFPYLYYNKEILPAIKVRKTSSINAGCYPVCSGTTVQFGIVEAWRKLW